MSSLSSTSSPSSSSSAVPSPHSGLSFFDSQPTSFQTLSRQSHDTHWYQIGHQQIAQALGVDNGSFDGLKPDTLPSPTTRGWLKSAAEEQAEVLQFLEWIATVPSLVRQVIEVLPPTVHATCKRIQSAELHDFSPKGVTDDKVFEQHRDVWEKITRGCTLIKINVQGGGAPIWRWAVRANRKFTGHEDDAAASDAKFYCVPGVAESVVVSHKCNGSVLHLAARDIEVDGEMTRWVFLGSKKVHVGCIWTGDAQDWKHSMELFKEGRHAYVSEMVQFVMPHLAGPNGERIIDLLAKLRLVVNAEYVSSIGTGPTDNERIYGLPADGREAYGFMLTFNTLVPGRGCELALDMMSALRILDSLGFKTVGAFQIPLSDLPTVKAQVAQLPDIEGAVLYYSSRDGLIQLEKWKSVGYVVLRAIREKLKPFIFGGRDKAPGLDQLFTALAADVANSGLTIRKASIDLLAEAKVSNQSQGSNEASQPKKKKSRARKKKANSSDESSSASSSPSLSSSSSSSVNDLIASVDTIRVDAPNTAATAASSSSSSSLASVSPVPSSTSFLVLTHPSLDRLGNELTTLGCTRVSEGEWRIECPTNEVDESQLRQRIQSAYAHGLFNRPIETAIEKALARIHGRIKSIDHIPMTEEERSMWTNDSTYFLRWLTKQIVEEKRWPARDVMNMYSKLWSLFRQERV